MTSAVIWRSIKNAVEIDIVQDSIIGADNFPWSSEIELMWNFTRDMLSFIQQLEDCANWLGNQS